MDGPIVFISRNRILDGQRDAFETAYAGAVRSIGSTKPRTTLFAAYVDDSGSEVRVIHAFPDAAAMLLHFEGSEDRSESAARLIAPAGFELYGPAAAGAVAQLRREAHAAGVSLDEFPDAIDGFLRPPV